MGKDKYNPFRKRPILPAKKPSGIAREIVTREVWGAAPAREDPPMAATALPVENVIFTYDTGTAACVDNESCQRTMREIQQQHMSHGLPDIAYNFVVGGDLKIYEARGWDIMPEKNEKFPNIHDNCIEIAYIGDHRNSPLDIPMTNLIKEGLHAVDIGIRLKNVTQLFRLSEESPILRVETMGSDERPYKDVRKCDLTLDDPPIAEAYET